MEYPYLIEDGDHCESPPAAYNHIAHLLHDLCKKLAKDPSNLKIYDPYYCEGSVKQNLLALGFSNVYNEKEDFYACVANNQFPDFDCVVTNPPYSGDHIPKLFDFVKSCSVPVFLLLPNFVCTKPYFDPRGVFYVVPKSRYQYSTPKGRRQEKTAKYTSPFASFWYCYSRGIPMNTHRSNEDFLTVTTTSRIPLNALPDNHPAKRRQKNSNKRKKNKKRQQDKKRAAIDSTS